MKYCVVILDGASGLPLPQRGGKTCLELAHTPNLDAVARHGMLGLARTVPPGMEPSSSCACISILGYDSRRYLPGRAGIEARSLGIDVDEGEVVFRCNLMAARDGRMWDYSAGHISSGEAEQLIAALNRSLGDDSIHFYPGVSYRHIVKLKGHEDSLGAICTPPHDIPDQPIDQFLPRGQGSAFLQELMRRSEAVLRGHPVNQERISRGDKPATMIWLFWGSGPLPQVPSFRQLYGISGAVTTAVDLLRGLARMIGMDVLEIPGVTDGLDNDYAAQAAGALQALDNYDLVVVHIEAPDEAAHAGEIDAKVAAIQKIDEEVIRRLRSWRRDELRLLVMPDHPTPIHIRTHSPDPVPFMLWGHGFTASGAGGFTEAEAKGTGLFIEEGYTIMGKLTGKE